MTSRLNILIPLCCLLLPSCSRILGEKVGNEWEERYVWSIAEAAQGVLNNAYAAIPAVPDTYGTNFLDVATDNAASMLSASSATRLSVGLLSVTDNPVGNWDACYRQLQYINSFLENGLGNGTQYDRMDSETDAAYKKRLYGEACFLRAWWTFQLLQYYGGKTEDGRSLGIPLANRFISEDELAGYASRERNTYEECVLQILSDCDEAIANLPAVYTGTSVVTGVANMGLATSLAAGALKSRVALYAASPAYRDDSVTRIDGMGAFTVLDESSYLACWERAALTADEVINMTGFGREFTAITAADLADAPNTTPSEFLLRSYRNTHALEERHFPPYYFGKANTVPSQNLVDAYPASNGYPIDDPRSGYDSSNPYILRDKRLDLTVYYHGRPFGNGGQTINVAPGGKDAYTYNGNGSITGYYLAKFLSRKEGILTPGAMSTSQHYWAPLRRAEVFLNYAEAANEAWGPTENPEGCTYSAYEIIKIIRSSSGGISSTAYLDEVAAQGRDAFRRLIANERRLELAFENQRYFDLRRTLSPLNEDVRGVSISLDGGSLVFGTDGVVSGRPFDDIRYYYFPIPLDEMLKNPEMTNNKGWK